MERPTKEQCTSSIMAVGDALYVIGGKWKLRIIIALSNGSKRFNELQRLLDGISAKVLSNELKELEMNGFVKRNIQTNYPVLVEYELKPYSLTLQGVVQSLSDWGAMHRENIKNNRLEI